MDDLLFKAAEAYKELMNYEYILIGGTSKRKIIISILSSDADKFTHVCGLEHLKDIPSVTAKKSREKEMIFKKILHISPLCQHEICAFLLLFSSRSIVLFK